MTSLTLLFEALAPVMCREMTVSAALRLMRAHANMLWLLSHYVDKAVEEADYSSLSKVGTDECATCRGHRHIATFCDVEPRMGIEPTTC